jgi:hypothetical protein
MTAEETEFNKIAHILFHEYSWSSKEIDNESFHIRDIIEATKQYQQENKIKKMEYKGWKIEKSDYANGYWEATNLSDCDAFMKHAKSVEQLKIEIDEK